MMSGSLSRSPGLYLRTAPRRFHIHEIDLLFRVLALSSSEKVPETSLCLLFFCYPPSWLYIEPPIRAVLRGATGSVRGARPTPPPSRAQRSPPGPSPLHHPRRGSRRRLRQGCDARSGPDRHQRSQPKTPLFAALP